MRAKTNDEGIGGPARPGDREEPPAVLVLLDWVNDLEFEGAEDLLEAAVAAAERTAALKRRWKAAGLPAIYANDNFGNWRADFPELVDRFTREGVRGRPIVELLAPDDDDYFILKPRHSAFYNTSLPSLLEHLGTQRLVLTGLAGDICVLMTAIDAYVRGYELVVPCDALASESDAENEHALDYMRRLLKAETPPAADLPAGLATGRAASD